MAHEVITNRRPDHNDLDLDPAMLRATANEIKMAEDARNKRKRDVNESFFEAVLLPILLRVRTEFSNGFDIGWFLAKK